MDETLRTTRNRQALGRIVGGAAHDFNNLLMVFQSSVALLRHSLDDVARQRVLEGMQRAVAQGSELTRALRRFGAGQCVKEALELAPLLADAARDARGLCGPRVEVQVSVQPGVARVRADRGQLVLALVNLCVNAAEAMGGAGVVRIEARGADEGVVIAVADTGAGMTDEVKARAFEPGFTTRPDGTAGLGLTQVLACALQSDGDVRIASEPGRGTTVELVLAAV